MTKLRLLSLFVALMTVCGVARTAFAQDPGYALGFDGASDFVRLTTTSAILGPSWQGTKTVSLWVKPTGSPTCTGPDPASCDAIFGDRPRTFGISRGVLGGVDRIWVWNYDGTFDSIGLEYSPGEWMQIGLVHGGGILSAYKNGALVGSVASGPTAQGSTSAVLHFGGIINNSSRNWTFEGAIDELQLWNVSRTASEILEGIGPLAGNENGLCAYYRMSDGAGTQLTDDSGHGWTGSLMDGGSGVPADGPIAWVASGAFGSTGHTNTPPVAEPQTAATDEDTAVTLALTGSDADGDTLTFRVSSPPAYGVLSGPVSNPTYTPNANFNGSDSFSFVVNDGHVDSPPAVVTLNVAPVNDPPSPAADTVTTTLDTSATVNVLANDVDIDGDPLVVTAVGAPSNGVAVIDGIGITYTPAAGFTGTDTFTYSVADSYGAVSTAAVTITVRPPGPDPGWALRFNGVSDLVSLWKTAYMMAPGWETTKTVSLWVKPTGSSACVYQDPASCDAIFGDRPRWWGISRGVINGLDRIWVWNYDGTFRKVAVEYTPEQWVHIALVHGGGVLSAYRNGVLVGQVPSGPTQQPTLGALPVLYLGGIINSAARNFTFEGELDEVGIWNMARSAEQIGQDMRAPLSGGEYGLAAYYRMSNGSGTYLNDDSGHGWTGTLLDGYGQVLPSGPILWVPSGAFSIP